MNRDIAAAGIEAKMVIHIIHCPDACRRLDNLLGWEVLPDELPLCAGLSLCAGDGSFNQSSVHL